MSENMQIELKVGNYVTIGNIEYRIMVVTKNVKDGQTEWVLQVLNLADGTTKRLIKMPDKIQWLSEEYLFFRDATEGDKVNESESYWLNK